MFIIRRPAMSLEDQHKTAHIAFNRFGLGAKPGGILRILNNPKAAIEAELDTPGIATIDPTGLPSYEDACHTNGHWV